jgi:hypothetical protein
MADSNNPIDIELSLAAFDAAYPNVFVTKKWNPPWVGVLPVTDIPGSASVSGHQSAEYGNRVDNFLRELVDKYTAIKHTGNTTNATPANLGAAGTVADGETLHVEAKIWGKYAANDIVYVEIRARLERNGGTVQKYTDFASTQYSNGGTLSTATADLIIDTNDFDVQVTGEAATAIAWEAYTIKREVGFA